MVTVNYWTARVRDDIIVIAVAEEGSVTSYSPHGESRIFSMYYKILIAAVTKLLLLLNTMCTGLTGPMPPPSDFVNQVITPHVHADVLCWSGLGSDV